MITSKSEANANRQPSRFSAILDRTGRTSIANRLLAIICYAIALTFPVGVISQTFGQTSQIKLSLQEHREQMMNRESGDQVELRLQFLERSDAPIADRNRVASELASEFEGRNEPRIRGLALLSKGTTLGHQGDLQAALATLLEAEKQGHECKDAYPDVFFKARSNRIAFMIAMGNKTEPVGLLREVIDFAKPHGDKLSVGHAYLSLALLAENAGATAKAVEYLQASFEMSTKANQAYVAAAAGQTIVALLYAEQQFEMAENWVEKTRPWVDQSANPGITLSFSMRCEELRIATGDPNLAADNLRKLATSAPPTVELQMIGLVYLTLSEAEHKLGHFDASIEAATEAISKLQAFPRSRFLAEYNRLEALNAKGEHAKVIDEISQLIEKSESFLIPSIKLRALNSKALGKLGQHEDALNELQRSNQLESKRQKERAQEQMSFMTAIYDDRERESQLAILKQQEIAIKASLELQEARAEQQTAVARFATQSRNLAICFSAILGVGAVVVVGSVFKRRAAQSIAKREQELNQDLNAQLEIQVAALKQTEEARRKLEAAMDRKERDEAIGKLTGSVAHDFNNLLTVILNSNEIIRMQEKAIGEPALQFLDSSTKAALTGTDIVKQLLSFARKQSLFPEKIQVSEWLQSVGMLFRQTVGKSVSYMEKDLSNGAAICIDASKLTTAVINLLSNAKDALGPNGSIELVITRINLNAANVGRWNGVKLGEYLLFEVHDNGKGISPEDLQHVCEPFFTTKYSKSGTGLGLSSVLGFVRQSLGEFQLTSEVGKGTSATFVLPECDFLTQKRRIDHVGIVADRKEKILVVDDQDSVRLSTAYLLGKMGYEVWEANNADSAIQLLDANDSIEIVLSDIQMPGSMDGLGFRNWLQSNRPHIRTLLMSGFTENDEVLGQRILCKPFTGKSLKDFLSQPQLNA